MRLYEIKFYSGETRIEVADTRMDIRRKYPGLVDKIYRVVIV